MSSPPATAPDRSTAPPPSRRFVANLLAQLAFGLLAMTICLPSMPAWREVFGASQSRVQLTFSGFVVAYGAMQLIYGPLSDRLGRRTVLLAGLGLAGLGSLLAALAPNLDALIVARVLQGAGVAAGMVVSRALVQDRFQGPERTRVMAWFGMTMGLCPPLATLVGGQVHVHLGWRANFLLIGLLSAGLFAAAWRGLPRGAPAAATVSPSGAGGAAGQVIGWRSVVQPYADLTREPVFLLYVAILALTTGTFYAFLSGAPVVLAGYGVGPEGVGLYIMCIPLAYIVGNWLTTRWIRRVGEPTIMVLGHALTVGSLLLMLALGLAGVNTALALTLPLVVLGLGHGLLVPPTLAGTVGLMPALAGSASAVAGLGQQLTGAAGGYAVGLLQHEGARQLSLLMLAGGVGAALAYAVLRQRLAQGAAQPLSARPR